MQRPVMDPMLMLDDEPLLPRRGQRSRAHEMLASAARAARWSARLLFSSPFRARRRDAEAVATPRISRWTRGLAYRMSFVPIFVALFASSLVYRGTHPVHFAGDKLPEVPGVFYETLEFNGTADGQPLMAWFVPVVDAKRVIELKNKVIHEKQPAVVLVHDFNETPSQMVPLVTPLHERGYVVAVVGLRGAGRGRVSAQTFGLNEAFDVRAALAELRKRQSVDADRIAIVGVGSGANAAVIAASQEPGIRALALVNPADSAEDVIASRIGPERFGFAWMQQASKWAFEIGYHVDADDLQLARYRDLLSGRPTMSLSRDRGDEFDDDTVALIRDFCVKNLPVKAADQLASGL
jgi:pimeloyl-ACP methyl ester carboxylesterase